MVLPSFAYLLATASGNTVDVPEISPPVWTVILGVGSLLGAGILVLTFAKLWMDVLGKRTATVNIQAHSDSDPHESPTPKVGVIDVTGFVATKDFDAHKEETRLRAVGLEKQISDSRHEWRNELNKVLQAATVRDETADEWRRQISDDVKGSSLKLAAVEKQADMIQATQTNMDAKLDRLIERHIPPAKPS